MVLDALGRTIHQQKILDSEENGGRHIIQLGEELALGIYTIHILEQGGKRNTFRISKI